VALSGDDPSALSLRLHYLGYVSRAAASLIAAHRAGVAELERPGGRGRGAARTLLAVERASRVDRQKILAERRERAACSSARRRGPQEPRKSGCCAPTRPAGAVIEAHGASS